MKLSLVLSILCIAGAARADSKNPWAEHVPADQQARANQLFADANELFAQEKLSQALAKYRAAIAIWDHPLIRFNMAVTEIRLDQVLEAADDLERALRFHSEPFTPELYQQALAYERLLARQIASFEASCDQRDVKISLDGKPWFVCPGRQRQRVLSGDHLIVGERAGYVTSSRRVMVSGGEQAAVRVELVEVAAVTRVEYPVRPWIPWTSAGAGGALAIVGTIAWFVGRGQIQTFDARFATACANGCASDLSDQPALAHQLAGGRSDQRVGAALIVGGAIAAVAGASWALFVNRPYRVVPVVDVTRGGGAGARLQWSW